MAKLGRPPRDPLVPPDIADAVVAWISEGKTLRAFCRQPGMPARRTVNEWQEKDDIFAARVARARIIGHDEIAEEALEIANTPKAGVITTEDEDGVKTVTEDMLGHRKLQIETRLKLLACWDPKRYGNKPEPAVNPAEVAEMIRSFIEAARTQDTEEGDLAE